MTRPGTILLVSPEWKGIGKQKQPQLKRIWQPLDLAIAAALLETEGFRVKILDNNIECLSLQKVGELSAGFEKIFVTSTPYDRWQCPSLNIDFFFNTIRHISKRRLYVMGAHVTERTDTILRQSQARAAILNAPEYTILEIAMRDSSTEIPPDIPGIAYIKDKRLIKSPPRNNLYDINKLPYPAYHLLHMDQYYYEFMGKNFAILEGSRGCPHKCSFCYLGMYGTHYRQKDLERMVEEIAYVKERFHLKNIYFMDLEFGLNRDYLISFCKALIQRQIKIEWCCQTRVTDVDQEVLKWMSASGCRLIHFGVEAGSDRILNQIGKKIRVSDCIRAVTLTHKAGIRTALFMNFGFPGESLKEMDATINLAIRLNPTYAAFHLIVPFPGTGLAREVGLNCEALPPHLYPHYNDVHHDPKTLKFMLRKAYLRFYLRPSYLIRLLRGQTRTIFHQGKLFLKLMTR